MTDIVKKLLNKMTVEEKIGQLIQVTGDFFKGSESTITGPLSENGRLKDEVKYMIGSVLGTSGSSEVKKIQQDYLAHSSLKIPLLFMADVIHGYKTIFPIPLGIAATFNPKMMKIASQVAASESAAAGLHVTFAPMVDLVRDPRWGRVMESTGEDPYLNEVMAREAVKGFQGNLPIDDSHIAATVKHFAGYGAAEAGREYNTVDMSEWQFRENYLGAYQSAIEAQAKLVMTSFNTMFGVPATGNKYLMKDILRQELEFNGVLISDWDAINELINHGTATDLQAATNLALNAGVDIDMMSFAYITLLEHVDELSKNVLKLIDESASRVLQLKKELGLFQNPYKGLNPEKENDKDIKLAHEKNALEVAEESIVMVKNNSSILPLSFDQRVFLTGPVADTGDLLGSWSWKGDVLQTKSLLFKMKKSFKNISFSEGINYHDRHIKDWDKISQQVSDADVIIVALGQPSSESGEATSMMEPTLPIGQIEYLKKLRQFNKPIVAIVVTGRPLILTQVNELVDAMLISFFPGTKGATALTNILTGKSEPTGRLPMTFPRNNGQIPIYYNSYTTGRPIEFGLQNNETKYVTKYIDGSNDPLYNFGDGLGYADISISESVIQENVLSMSEQIKVSVILQNKSNRSGQTVLQGYIHQKIGETVHPTKALKWFKKIEVPAKNSRKIMMSIPVNELASVHQDLSTSIDLGEYEIMVGLNSTDLVSHNLTIE
ncbi:glycoside hydrolase family 3 N-terminal domain-containing protein [Weissella paramesenteroides]|uniref:glycoside hydrolase family 3 N-terminal domain-containing protein n=1 Tax=Weissella paramesenteroides TaxID=1249 RepID=UPI002E7C5334|nr:glycoside hydrolase family 3 N-terminal domain-containing protein [Weissella paramesenteroides]WPQ68720.1 glycoside hydrolase family 3 N-terminal domain-containing protein [Weissella paramesenteroides]